MRARHKAIQEQGRRREEERRAKEKSAHSSTYNVDFQAWLHELGAKDPVVGANIAEMPLLEPFLNRCFQISVRELYTANKRVGKLEEANNKQTRTYMQEVLMLREKDRKIDEAIASEAIGNAGDVKLFFDPMIALSDSQAEIVKMVVREKVGDALDLQRRKYCYLSI